MSISKYMQARALLNQHSVETFFVGPQPPTRIERAEQILGCRFSPSYRRFLLEFGCGGIGIYEIFGIVDDDFQSHTPPAGIGSTLDIRKWGLTHHNVVVGQDGMGGVYCLECSATDEAFEGDIRVFEPGLEMQYQLWELIAPSFGDYFLNCVVKSIVE